MCVVGYDQHSGRMMTPGQYALGHGHLRGASPSQRTAALRNSEQALNAATAFIPLTGPMYQMGQALREADTADAGLNAAAAATGGVSRALPVLLRWGALGNDAQAAVASGAGVNSDHLGAKQSDRVDLLYGLK